MTFVINIEDGGGQEFFVTLESRPVRLSDKSSEQPQKFQNVKAVMKRMDQLRPKYPPVCRIYALELREFETRRKIVQDEAATKKGGEMYSG